MTHSQPIESDALQIAKHVRAEHGVLRPYDTWAQMALRSWWKNSLIWQQCQWLAPSLVAWSSSEEMLKIWCSLPRHWHIQDISTKFSWRKCSQPHSCMEGTGEGEGCSVGCALLISNSIWSNYALTISKCSNPVLQEAREKTSAKAPGLPWNELLFLFPCSKSHFSPIGGLSAQRNQSNYSSFFDTYFCFYLLVPVII